MDKLLEITRKATKKLTMTRKLVKKLKTDYKRGSFLLHRDNSSYHLNIVLGLALLPYLYHLKYYLYSDLRNYLYGAYLLGT